jgi:dihydropyrimidine dehydrogenase (NAD+) subunit PreT
VVKQETLEQGFIEKNTSYSSSQAVIEAERCLYCFDPPCVKACPTGIDIPKFIKSIATKDTSSAAKTIMASNVLGYSCAKVCPVEVLCQGSCVYVDKQEPAIAIGRLQRFAMEHALLSCTKEQILGPGKKAANKKIALVGAGPASIAAAVMLAAEGFSADIFDKRSFAGGLNSCGIAPYKLKRDEALAEISWLSSPNITFHGGVAVTDHNSPNSRSAVSLEEEYDAIFLGFGLGEGRVLDKAFTGIPNVWDAYQLIEAIKTNPDLDFSWVKRAHIIGGGNSAIDAAHILRMLKIDYVAMLYRGNEQEASGYTHELDAAKKSGVHFFERCEVKEIIHEGKGLTGFIEKNSNKFEPSDLMVFAIGQKTHGGTATIFTKVEIDSRGLVKVDEKTYRTHNPKIWSAGDCVNGGKEVVYAVAEAKVAVRDMLKYLKAIMDKH